MFIILSEREDRTVEPYTLHPHPHTLNPQPSHPQPSTLKPQTPNPKSGGGLRRDRETAGGGVRDRRLKPHPRPEGLQLLCRELYVVYTVRLYRVYDVSLYQMFCLYRDSIP